MKDGAWREAEQGTQLESRIHILNHGRAVGYIQKYLC